MVGSFEKKYGINHCEIRDRWRPGLLIHHCLPQDGHGVCVPESGAVLEAPICAEIM